MLLMCSSAVTLSCFAVVCYLHDLRILLLFGFVSSTHFLLLHPLFLRLLLILSIFFSLCIHVCSSFSLFCSCPAFFVFFTFYHLPSYFFVFSLIHRCLHSFPLLFFSFFIRRLPFSLLAPPPSFFRSIYL